MSCLSQPTALLAPPAHPRRCACTLARCCAPTSVVQARAAARPLFPRLPRSCRSARSHPPTPTVRCTPLRLPSLALSSPPARPAPSTPPPALRGESPAITARPPTSRAPPAFACPPAPLCLLSLSPCPPPRLPRAGRSPTPLASQRWLLLARPARPHLCTCSRAPALQRLHSLALVRANPPALLRSRCAGPHPLPACLRFRTPASPSLQPLPAGPGIIDRRRPGFSKNTSLDSFRRILRRDSVKPDSARGRATHKPVRAATRYNLFPESGGERET